MRHGGIEIVICRYSHTDTSAHGHKRTRTHGHGHIHALRDATTH